MDFRETRLQHCVNQMIPVGGTGCLQPVRLRRKRSAVCEPLKGLPLVAPRRRLQATGATLRFLATRAKTAGHQAVGVPEYQVWTFEPRRPIILARVLEQLFHSEDLNLQVA